MDDGVIENPVLFDRANDKTSYISAPSARLNLMGELRLPGGVSNTTMRVNGEGGAVHFSGPSPDFMGRLYLETSFTLFLDHPNAMTNVNRIFFDGGWGSRTYLNNNTGAPMLFPRCEKLENTTGWSNTRPCYAGAPFLFPVATFIYCDRAGDGTIDADLMVTTLRVTKNQQGGPALNKYGNGTLGIAGTTEWASQDQAYYINLRNGCFWPKTAAGQSPSGEYYAPEGASSNMGTLGLNGDYSPMLDGSSMPRMFQSNTRARWGFTGFGGDCVVCWNGDSSFNLTNTTSDNVTIKLSADTTDTNGVGKAYNDYYAYPARFMFGNRSEFADGTVIFMNPIRYTSNQDWDTATYFESTNHVVAARMRGSLRLGKSNKMWNFSGRNFGGYLALEADNADFTGKINVYEKGNLLVNSNLVAQSVTVQSGSGLGGVGSLSTVDGTTVKNGGALFGGEWNKGGTLTLGGTNTFENGSALRAEIGASNDRVGCVKLAAGSKLNWAAPIFVDVDTDPKVSPVKGSAVKIFDWSASDSALTREDFVARIDTNADMKKISLTVRDRALYVSYITRRCPKLLSIKLR